MERFTAWIPILGTLLIPALVIALFIKRQSAKRNLTYRLDDGPLIGTDADRERAEKERASFADHREELLKTHVLLHRFSTLQGYSETFINDLVRALLDAGIPADTIFQETIPAGVADAILRQGVYELYVDRDQIDDAATIIREKLR